MRVTLDRKLINLWPSIFMVINDNVVMLMISLMVMIMVVMMIKVTINIQY